MSTAPIPPGKLPSALLAQLLANIGSLTPDVLVGPAVGEDACALVAPAGILVAATDPITLTGRHVGRLSVFVNANDVAVMGARPRWFLAAVLLPLGTTTREVHDLFDDINDALSLVGATLVGGHTEVTAAVNQPVVVGQMIGVAEPARLIRSSGVQPGDAIVQVGPVPVEGGAVIASALGSRLTALEPAVVRAALAGFDDPGISVVDAALAASELGATALHDPTEGGLAGGLNELAAAAGVALQIERDEVLWFGPGVAVCQAVGADPWATLASGSLLAAFAPADTKRAVEALIGAGHVTAVIGVAVVGEGVHDTHGLVIVPPPRDETARILAG